MIEPGMIEAEIPHLRRYARALLRDREAADDLVQDTLERAWRKRHLWRPHGRLRGWLFRVLYRLYLDGHPAPTRDRDKLIALDTLGLDPRDRSASNGLRLHCRDVLAAMDRLSPEHRAILMLAALEQPSYRDGARMLGIRVGTFRSRLSRARQRLNELMQADEGPPCVAAARG
ncbi:RNA polymerase sigma factor [Salinisphaera sp. RV14]|uniref:RNA polymerase sigma factor n=1 Tax=unclassified Salinisphaera TaxID=2649847 RepID=UPI003F8295F8